MRKSYIALLKIVLASIFTALSIVLTRFASVYIQLTGFPSQRLGLGSIPIVLASLMCGPFLGMMTGGLSDLIGAFAFPSGPYFYGYTISSAILGLLPWTTIHLFKKKRYLFLFDALAFFVTMIGIVTYIYSATSYGNGKPNAKYQFEFTSGIRLAILAVLVAIGVLCICSSYLGYLYQTRKDINSKAKPVLEKYKELREKGKKKSEAISQIKEYLEAGPITSSLFFNEDLMDVSFFSKLKIKRILNILLRKEDTYVYELKDEKSTFTYLEVYSALFIPGVFTNILLLPFWNQLFFGLPYGYSLFNSALIFFISLPIKVAICWAFLVPIDKMGYFELLKTKKR